MKLFRQFTWQSLKANRSRTLVTIIGIILSVALLTAVAAGAYSGQQYMVEVCQAMEGNYHAFGEELSKEALAKLENEAQVTSVATLERIGYAQGNELNAQRPYLYLAAASANLQDLLAVHLEQGRLPLRKDEIARPPAVCSRTGSRITWAAPWSWRPASVKLVAKRFGRISRCGTMRRLRRRKSTPIRLLVCSSRWIISWNGMTHRLILR